jgi:hypothetical protein
VTELAPVEANIVDGESLGRVAALDASIVGVGHGDPITHDAADRVHSLAA